MGEDFAQRHGMYFLETSAKEAENVERLFMEIAAELMEVIISNGYFFKNVDPVDLTVIKLTHYSSKHAVRNYLDMKQMQPQ